MKKRIKVAVIGCGAIAESAHIPNLLNIPNIEIVGLCDVNKERLEATSQNFSIFKTFPNHQTMINELDFDAGVVCTTADVHAEICIDLLNAQKDVFVEKPLALSSEDARKVIKTVEDTGRTLQVGYQMRFLANHTKAKEILKKEIGTIYAGRVTADTLVIKVHETLLVDYMTHLFDLVRWYLEEDATHIGGMLYYENDIQTGAQVLLHFPSGKLVSVDAFWVPKSSWGSVQRRIEFRGSQGKLITDVTGPTITLYKETSFLSKMRSPIKIMPVSSLNQYVPITDAAYRDELRSFFDSVRKGRKPLCDVHDGLMALLIAEAAKESYFKHRIVDMNEFSSENPRA